MSHATAMVRFQDGSLMWAEYDGTCDVVRPTLYPSEQAMCDRWRSDDWNACTCGNAEPVIYANDYGGGAHWPMSACRSCRAIVGDLSADEWPGEVDGLPSWWPLQTIAEVTP